MMTLNEIILTVYLENMKLGDARGNLDRNWELLWWMNAHCAD